MADIFVCPGCGQPCGIPTQPKEISECPCGMAFTLTPSGVAKAGTCIHPKWAEEKQAKERADRIANEAKLAKENEGKCPACGAPKGKV